MLRFPAGFVGVQMRGLILWLLFVVFGAVPAFAERYALVVGIDRYTRLEPLRKATNDARAVAKTLESAGFGVTLSLDPDADALYDKLASFTAALRPGDEVVVYFAGHGVEVEGRNWLLPADMAPLRPGDEVKLRRAALATDDLLAEISARGPQVTLMILDACRDNPFPRQGTRSVGNTRGLARLEAPRGSYVIYSAGAGQTALDRLGEGDANPNSVFTRALLPRLAQPGLSIRDLAQQVRLEVDATARSIGHDQFPAIYDQLAGDFVIAGTSTSAPVADGFAPSQLDQPLRAVPDEVIELEDVYPHAERLSLSLIVDGGVRVAAVTPGSEAHKKGIKAGDLLKEAGQMPLGSAQDFEVAVEQMLEAGRRSILLLIYRGDDPRFVALGIK